MHTIFPSVVLCPLWLRLIAIQSPWICMFSIILNFFFGFSTRNYWLQIHLKIVAKWHSTKNPSGRWKENERQFAAGFEKRSHMAKHVVHSSMYFCTYTVHMHTLMNLVEKVFKALKNINKLNNQRLNEDFNRAMNSIHSAGDSALCSFGDSQTSWIWVSEGVFGKLAWIFANFA